jgi:type IV pilus assembly protein PilX
MIRTFPSSPRRQGGNTLVIGVILLLLLTLLVISAGRGISLQTTMAGNTRDREVAFQAAESALRDAETRIPTFHGAFAGAGLITSNTAAEIATRATAAYWTNPAAPSATSYGWYNADGSVNTGRSLQSATNVNGVDQQPRYVVERLPNGPIDPLHPGPGTKYLECAVDQVHHRYRVTTIAVGASAGARKSADTRVVLQAEIRYCL